MFVLAKLNEVKLKLRSITMKKHFRCRNAQLFNAKVFSSFVLFILVAVFLSSLIFAEEQKKSEKSGCPYLKATSGCSAKQDCVDKKECKEKKTTKSDESACESKSSSSSSEKCCDKKSEKKKVSSNSKCETCNCCSACNCSGQKQSKLACSCGDKCSCCASCCSYKV